MIKGVSIMKKGRMLVVIGLIISTVWLSVVAGIHSNFNESAKDFKETRAQLLSRSIESVTSSYEQFSNFIFETIVNTDEVTAMMADANDATKAEKGEIREELYQAFEEIYKISNNYEFRQLHFHLKNGESFLRMHAKDKFGDPLFDIRESVRIANMERRYVTGFEEGRIFNGYRFVYPLYHGAQHVGSVEVSISLKSIINILNDMYPTMMIGFILDRDVMESTVFSDEQSHYQLSYISDQYVIDKEVFQAQLDTDQEVFNNNNFFDTYKEVVSSELKDKQSFNKQFHFGGQDYIAVYLQTLNVEQVPVGYYTFVLPTNEFKAIVGTRRLLIATATVIYLLITLLLYILYQRQQAILTLATKDPLTGLYNRHKFNQLVGKYLKTKKAHCLMLMDIDHFKQVNDTFGHNVGDEVLVTLAERMRSVLQHGEIFARHGGEEFIVFFPNTSMEKAERIAEELRARIESEPMPKVGQVTISIGLTDVVTSERLIQTIERADKALYEAKHLGRNRVVTQRFND